MAKTATRKTTLKSIKSILLRALERAELGYLEPTYKAPQHAAEAASEIRAALRLLGWEPEED